MPNIDVCGLVTREVKYGENSRILTVLAKDRQGFGSCQPCENQPFRFADCNTAFCLF
mgnify:CR=1 FL=1